MELTDHELMGLCRHGDAAAFERLMRRWEAPVGRVLVRLLGARGPVEDLSQEVFLRVFSARSRYRPSASFSTWLYRIVLNVFRDTLRRQRLRRWQLFGADGSGAELGGASGEASPSEALGREELHQRVEVALRQLGEKLREVVVLKHYGELTFDEISEVTGLPPSTVKYRVGRGLEKLAVELRRLGIDEKDLGS